VLFLYGGGEDVMSKLTDKQEAFVREYMIDLNATQAYLRAGYKVSDNVARANASRLLTNANIHARIEQLQADRAKKLELDANWVLQRLKDISDRCMQAEPVLEFDYEEKKLVETGEYKFDSNGANKATELIGKHLGMFKDKLEVNGETKLVVKRRRMNEDAGDNN
jgi:phage terminase small subunit